MKTRLLLFAILMSLQPAFATTFTVNSLAATNTGGGISGTLLYCMNIATITPGGPHTIVFSVAGTIAIGSDANLLPDITSSGLSIDATTAPGYVDVPVVLVDFTGTTVGNGFNINTMFGSIQGLEIANTVGAGISVSVAANGFDIGGCTVRNCGTYGISVNGCSSGAIHDCKIGVTSDGIMCAMNQFDGIDIQGGGNHQILNNHVACNGYNGIQLGGSDGNVIQGNIIGPLMGVCTYNGYRGIDIEGGSSDNIIGGTGPGEANKISGNDYWGVEVKDAGSIANIISGNSMSCNVYGAIDINTGGNNNIIPPVITAADGTSVSGTSSPNAVIEVFRAPDVSGFPCAGTPLGQGSDYFGTTNADGTGNWTMTGTFSGYLTATQHTLPDGTSAFSNPFDTGVSPTWTNGCSGPAMPLGATPVADFSINPDTICAGECADFIDLSTNLPTQWSWIFAGGSLLGSTWQNPNVCYDNPGTFNVTLNATNSNGTGTIVKSITVLPLPVVVITQNGIELSATSGHTSYQWYFNGSLLPGETDDTAMISSNGDYYCVVTGTNGCVDSSANYTVTDVGVGLNDLNVPQIHLYPNPATTDLMIYLGESAGLFCDFNVTDAAGNIVLTGSLMGSTTHFVDVTNLANGLYFVQFKGELSQTLRFYKE